jgi:hypothetical protein
MIGTEAAPLPVVERQLVLRSGCFGLKKAGKSVATGVLYKEETGAGLSLTVLDEASLRYLRPLAAALERGDVPAATHGPPTYLKWRVTLDDTARYELETTDFPGELLEALGQDGRDDPVGEEALAQFRRQVRDWFVQCDSILLFIDSTNPGTLRYRDALVKLLDELAQRPTLRGSSRRAIGVVFTKVDEVVANPTALAEPGDDWGRGDELHPALTAHPVYQVVLRRLREYRENVHWKIFATSALGWNYIAQPNRAKRTVEPHGLFEATRWALEQSAELIGETHSKVLDDLEREIQDGGDDAWMLTNFRSLFRILDDADGAFHLSTGPCAARFAALKRGLASARRNQRRALLGSCMVLLLALLGAGYHFAREARIATYDVYDRLAVERPGEPGVKERLAFYDAHIGRNSWNWFWGTTERRRSADARAEEDRALLPGILAEEGFAAWVELDEADQRAGRPAHRHQATRAFLAEHGPHAKPDRIEVVTRVAAETRAAYNADRAEFVRLSGIPAASEEQYTEKARLLRAYAGGPDALAAAEARALADSTLRDWDRAEYADLVRTVQQNQEPAAFDRTEGAAGAYLRAGRHPRTMTAEVERLCREIAQMRSGKYYSVKIHQVHIPMGSDLHAEFWGFPNCSVKLAVGGTVRETRPVKPSRKDADGGFTVTINQTLGPYWGTWGCNTATLTVTTNRSVRANDAASGPVAHSTLLMAAFNGRVSVTCRKGKTVTLVTECPDARLTPLPRFRG